MKKAQAAMDFIITYSWAILAFIAVISVLGFFGALSPEKYIASKCIFLQQEFSCISHKIEPGAITLSIQNLKKNDVEINGISFEDCSMEQKIAISSNETKDVSFSGCQIGEKDGKFREELELKYRDASSNFVRSAVLAIDSRIE